MALGNLGVDGVSAGNALPVFVETPNGDSAMDDVNDALRVNLVAGNVSISGADGAITDGADPLIKATVIDHTNSNPLAVAIVDGSGSQITSFGGGTQYTEGDTDASITGTALLFEGAGNALVAATGDATNGLDVDVTRSALPTGASTSAKQDTIIGHLDGVEGLLTTIDADTGALAGCVSGAELQVDIASSVLPTGASTLAEQQSQTTHLATIAGDTTAIETAVQLIDDVVYVDDTATHATGTSKGVLLMAAATPTDGSVSANDIGAVAMTVDRKLHVAVMDALPAGTNGIGKLTANTGVDIGDVDVTSVVPGTGATNLGKAEDAGHTSADVGVYNLGVRNDTPNTALTDTNADYASLTTDKVGGIRTALYETDFAVLGTNHVKKYYTNSGAATDGIIWSPAAGKRWYVTDIFINISAAATITLEDDLAGGDAAVWKAELAANSGWSHSFHTPLFSGEDAADLIITTSAGNVYVTVTGYEI